MDYYLDHFIIDTLLERPSSLSTFHPFITFKNFKQSIIIILSNWP